MGAVPMAAPAFMPTASSAIGRPAVAGGGRGSVAVARGRRVGGAVRRATASRRAVVMAADAPADGAATAASTPASSAAPRAPPAAVTDLYTPFWEYAVKVMKERLPDLGPYPIPEGYVHKEAMTGKGKRAALVTTDAYAYQTPKLRQIRAAHVQGGAALQVLNYVIFPHMNYRIPFFGADLVTLPGGHLIAIDMQPLFHTDEYKAEFYDAFKAVHAKHQAVLPWGGDFPAEAAQFFSPCFLWTRTSGDEAIQGPVFDAFKDYLHTYLDFVDAAKPVSDSAEIEAIKASHKAYLTYRAEKDPARGMFLRFYGEEWTEEFIHGFLFDGLVALEQGYTPPVAASA